MCETFTKALELARIVIFLKSFSWCGGRQRGTFVGRFSQLRLSAMLDLISLIKGMTVVVRIWSDCDWLQITFE